MYAYIVYANVNYSTYITNDQTFLQLSSNNYKYRFKVDMFFFILISFSLSLSLVHLPLSLSLDITVENFKLHLCAKYI